MASLQDYANQALQQKRTIKDQDETINLLNQMIKEQRKTIAAQNQIIVIEKI